MEREDIECFGWFFKGTSPDSYDYFWDIVTKKNSILYSYKLKRAIITIWDNVRKEDYTAFVGTIKHKEELKTIMKQIGIL